MKIQERMIKSPNILRCTRLLYSSLSTHILCKVVDYAKFIVTYIHPDESVLRVKNIYDHFSCCSLKKKFWLKNKGIERSEKKAKGKEEMGGAYKKA